MIQNIHRPIFPVTLLHNSLTVISAWREAAKKLDQGCKIRRPNTANASTLLVIEASGNNVVGRRHVRNENRVLLAWIPGRFVCHVVTRAAIVRLISFKVYENAIISADA